MTINTSNNSIINTVIGIAGLIGIGYAISTHNKMTKVSKRLELTIDQLAEDMTIDIPQTMVEKAVEKAVHTEAKKAVEKATAEALAELRRDIRANVTAAVDKEYETIKDSVLKETAVAASKINVDRVRRDVEAAAEKMALEKFEVNLDGILDKFNDNLSNTSKIYSSIAGAMVRPAESGKEVVFRVG